MLYLKPIWVLSSGWTNGNFFQHAFLRVFFSPGIGFLTLLAVKATAKSLILRARMFFSRDWKNARYPLEYKYLYAGGKLTGLRKRIGPVRQRDTLQTPQKPLV
jgi:hypothetical protein